MDLAIVIAVLSLVLVVAIVIAVILKRYKVAGPSEAIIVTGRKGQIMQDPVTGEHYTDLTGQKVVMGGGVFVLPFVQRWYTLSLASRRISVRITGAVSQAGIRLSLEGVAIVKVGGSDDAIRAAAQRFLYQQTEIEGFTQEVLAGSLRSIVGTLTVDQIIRDRAAFASKVAEESESSLTNQGLVLDTFQIQDVTDDGSYLTDLGRPEAALAAQRAAIAEANARQEAQQAQLQAEEQIANSERNLRLRQAEIRSETDAANAQAAASGPLQEAARNQEILAEQEKAAERQAALTERELEVTVRKPADAARYRIEQEAQARRSSEIAEAEARRAAVIAAAEGEAERQRLTGLSEYDRRAALAKAVQVEGESDAAAIRARGLAEAEAMQKKAEAFEQYGNAAVTQMLVEILPEVAREIAAPMGNIKDLTVISTDGASELSKNVSQNLYETMTLVEKTTGVNLTELISGIAGRGNTPK